LQRRHRAVILQLLLANASVKPRHLLFLAPWSNLLLQQSLGACLRPQPEPGLEKKGIQYRWQAMIELRLAAFASSTENRCVAIQPPTLASDLLSNR